MNLRVGHTAHTQETGYKPLCWSGLGSIPELGLLTNDMSLNKLPNLSFFTSDRVHEDFLREPGEGMTAMGLSTSHGSPLHVKCQTQCRFLLMCYILLCQSYL